MASKPWILSVNFLPAGEEEAKAKELFSPFGLQSVEVKRQSIALVTLDSREHCEAAIEACAGTKFGDRTLYVVFADPDENIASISLEGYEELPTEQAVTELVQKFGPLSYVSISTDQKTKKPAVIVDLLGKYAKAMKAASKEGELKTPSGANLTVKDSRKKAQPPKPKAKPAKPAPAKVEAKKEEAAAPAEQVDVSAFELPGVLTDVPVFPVFPEPKVISTRSEVDAPDVLAEHQKWLREHKYSIVTRFPPEPNGFLHIGHVKAMFLDFGLANLETALGDKIRKEKTEKGIPLTEEDECKRGVTYLRYDDTNPKGERQFYMDAIAETVAYLGHHPFKVTYTSDYFDQLYEYALQLIKRGLAYVDHQTKAQIKYGKDNLLPSPYRDRTVEENLRLFEDMRLGLCAEGECVLRLKIDPKSYNPNMRDPTIYRVMYLPHPRTGDKWCIYPTYDYSHCICDSLEHVTHSLCTLEFENRRDPYFWILDVLHIHKPIVWEMARLNVTNAVMSKRRVLALIKNGTVSGWDDPRLTSLAGLRRRGFNPEILHSFIRKVGITRNENLIQFSLLEYSARAYFNLVASRIMGILDPVELVLDNFDESAKECKTASEYAAPNEPVTDSNGNRVEFLSIPDFPVFPKRGSHLIPFARTVLIDRSDFREEADKNFFGLVPGKEVGLKYACHVLCTSVEKDATGKVTRIHGLLDRQRQHKVKGHLTWVAKTGVFPLPCPTPEDPAATVPVASPIASTTFCYNPLFTTEDLNNVENWQAYLNPNSRETYPNAALDISVLRGNIYTHTHASNDISSDSAADTTTTSSSSSSSAPADCVRVNDCFQLERVGFFCVDRSSVLPRPAAGKPLSENVKIVLNRTVSLRDTEKKKE